MHAASNKKIQVENLRTFYGAKEVHHGISFHIEPNEIFAIIGPAQSGKTTLLRAINRTLEFTPGTRITGTIKVDGEDVQKTRDVYGLRRKIGMVAPFQQLSIRPTGVPAAAVAYMYTVTSTQPLGTGYVVSWPCPCAWATL